MTARPKTQTPTLAATMSEAELQAAIIDLAQLLGWRVHHSRPARMRDGSWRTPIAGDAGFFDLVMAKPGEPLLLVELKSETGKQSEEQLAWVKAIGATLGLGVTTHLGRSGRSGCTFEFWLWRPSDWVSGAIERTLRGCWRTLQGEL